MKPCTAALPNSPLWSPRGADIGERLNRGEPQALEEAYRTLGPLVLSYLGRNLPQADVEDVLQRVRYEVWRVRDR